MMRRSLLSRIASLPFLAVGVSQAQAQAPPKKLKIMMKERLGTRRSHPGCLSLRARTCACRSRPRLPDFPSCRDHFVASQVHGKRDLSSRLAAAQRDAPKGCGQTHPRLCLKRLLPGPCGHGNRPESMGRQVRQPGNFRLARGMGGPHHR